MMPGIFANNTGIEKAWYQRLFGRAKVPDNKDKRTKQGAVLPRLVNWGIFEFHQAC